MSSGTSTQQPRAEKQIPKLSYRNASLERASPDSDRSVSSTTTSFSGIAISPDSQSPSNHASDTSTSMSTTYDPNTGALSKHSSQSTYLSPPERAKSAKKKSSSLFSFLSAKEPSTQAWLDYQESIRKQQERQDGKITAVGMPMVSSQKLPAKVPKVNSKWDGVPEAVVQREKARKAAARRSMLGHRRQVSNAYSTGTIDSRPSLQLSNGQSNRRKSQVSVNSYGTVPPSSGSDTSVGGEISPTPSSINAKDFASIFTTSIGSAPQTPLSEVSSFVSSHCEVPEILFDSHNVSPSSLDEEPRPSASSPSLLVPSNGQTTSPSISRSSSHHSLTTRRVDIGRQSATSSINTTILTIPPQDRVIIKSTGPHILGPPASARRQPKGVEPFLASEAQQLQLPDSKPRSSLKGDAGCQKTSSTISRPPISAYFSSQHKPQRATPDWPLRTDDRAQSDSTALPADVPRMDRKDTSKPEGNKGSLRKNRMSLFKSSTTA